MAKQVVRSLYDQKYSKELCKIQLESFECSLEYVLQSQKNKCRKKIEEFFKVLKDRVKAAEITCLKKLEDMHNQNIDNILETNNTGVIREKIQKHQERIEKYLLLPEDEMLSKFNKVKSMINHDNRYFKKLQFPEKQVNFKTKDSLIKRIEDLIGRSFSFENQKTNSKDNKSEIKK